MKSSIFIAIHLFVLLLEDGSCQLDHQIRPMMNPVNHPAGPFVANQIVQGEAARLADRDSLLLPTGHGDFDVPTDSITKRTLHERVIDVVTRLGHDFADDDRRQRWLWSAAACSAIVACGVLPVLLLPSNSASTDRDHGGRRRLNLLLSFAVGTLLGDVFLHLLPEIWSGSTRQDILYTGRYVVAGVLLCLLAEKCCSSTEQSRHRIGAIINLIANAFDNFTHGLAIGASFLVSIRLGMLTTLAILIHEIPHEISDFAMLLRADFNRVTAAKAQLATAMFGVMGATAALMLDRCGDAVDSINGSQSVATGGGSRWILSFTAGGFLNIALVQLLPDLIKERNSWESVKQLSMLIIGIAMMYGVNSVQLA